MAIMAGYWEIRQGYWRSVSKSLMTLVTRDTHDTFLKILNQILSIMSGCEPSNYTQKVALFHIDTTKKKVEALFLCLFFWGAKVGWKEGENEGISL